MKVLTGLGSTRKLRIAAGAQRALARWLKSARAAGLDLEDVEPWFRAGVRDGFAEEVA